MKKHLLSLLLILSALAGMASPTLQQGNWRWRNDNGSETSATWKAPKNTSFELTGTGAFRLRFEVSSLTTDTVNQYSLGLMYAKNNESAIPMQLGLTSNNEHFLISTTSTTLTNGEATTDQFGSESYFPSNTFLPGSVSVGSLSLPYIAKQPTRQEFEFVIKPTAFIEPGAIYTFSIGSLISRDASVPAITLTTPSVLPVKLSSFLAQGGLNGISVKWRTASETNNGRFDLERSTDGSNWTAIASLQGKGTSTSPADYEYLDTEPANGKNYYRLGQTDVNGKTTLSYSIEENYSVVAGVSVYPNPFTNKLSINLPAYSGKTVNVKLTDLQGRTLVSRDYQVNNNSIEFIPSANLKSGFYMLSVTGISLNYSTKVQVN